MSWLTAKARCIVTTGEWLNIRGFDTLTKLYKLVGLFAFGLVARRE
jgi:hypothetical protein